jgi:hypothetical protein
VLSVGSSVELFQDPVYAAQFLHERFGDFERFRGAVPGFQLSAHARFDAIGVGDEAAGERLKVKVSGVVTGYVTDVWFRRGRIVGYVEVVRADKQAAHDVALELATALDHRIQAVLAGEIEVEKAKPPKSKEATAAELRKLPSQTLAPADVGPNAVVLEEGPTEDEDYAGYQRSFRDLKVGGSRVLWLNGETQLYETGKHAELAYKVRTEKAGRLIFAQAVIDGFAGGAGLTPTDVRARALAIPAGGLKGLVVTFELQEAKFAMVGVFTRSGRLVQSPLAIGRTATFEADDLEAVARRAKKRLAS